MADDEDGPAANKEAVEGGGGGTILILTYQRAGIHLASSEGLRGEIFIISDHYTK